MLQILDANDAELSAHLAGGTSLVLRMSFENETTYVRQPCSYVAEELGSRILYNYVGEVRKRIKRIKLINN